MKPQQKSPEQAGSGAGRAEKAAARRVDIVNAALDEFTEHGFAAARMDSIARRAAVAKGTIYLHFQDKEALFEAIVQQEIGPLVASAGSSLEPGESVHAFLARTFLPILKDIAHSRRGALVRLLIAEAGRFPSLADVYYRNVVSPGLKSFSKLLRTAAQNGELKDDTLARFPQLLMAPMVLGLVWSGLFSRFHHIDIEAMARVYFDQLFIPVPASPKTAKSGSRGKTRG